MPIPADIASAFQVATRVRRSELYGTDSDQQMPNSLVESAQTPYVGFVGQRYQTGGTLLMAVNPGGGGDTQVRTPGDAALEMAILKLRDAPEAEVQRSLEAMTDAYLKQIDVINIGRLISVVLCACRTTRADVAFLNLFPYRTREDAKPAMAAAKRAVDLITTPLVRKLAPARIIFLGKKVSDIARGRIDGPRTYTIERTRGDRRICDAAARVLEQLKADCA